MALSAPVLGLQIALAANPLGPTPIEIAQWTAIAAAIISHFEAFGVITLPTAGVATIIAPSGGGPCTGTGVGTIA